MRAVRWGLLAALLAGPALAQPASLVGQPTLEQQLQAAGRMVNEAQVREFNARAEVLALVAQVTALRQELAAAKADAPKP